MPDAMGEIIRCTTRHVRSLFGRYNFIQSYMPNATNIIHVFVISLKLGAKIRIILQVVSQGTDPVSPFLVYINII